MKKAKLFGSLTLLSGVALTLAACGNNSNSKVDNPTKNFKSATPKKAVKKGGTVSVALESDTPFTGIFLNELSDNQNDSDAMAPANEGLFDTDDTYQINDKGPATLKLDNDNKTATIKIKNGVKWSDGKQVTAKDIEYSDKAKTQLAEIKKIDKNHLPVIIAKTQYSFTDKKKILGAPEDFTLHVKDLALKNGAGFIVVATGSILDMPGLPKHPAALDIDVDNDGKISGLF